MSNHHELDHVLNPSFTFGSIMRCPETGSCSITVGNMFQEHVDYILRTWFENSRVRRFNVVITNMSRDYNYGFAVTFTPDNKIMAHPQFDYFSDCVLWYSALSALASAYEYDRTYREKSIATLYLVRKNKVEHEEVKVEEVKVEEEIYRGEWTLSLTCPLSKSEVPRVIGYRGTTIRGLTALTRRSTTHGSSKITITNSERDSALESELKIGMWGENRGLVELYVYATYFAASIAML